MSGSVNKSSLSDLVKQSNLLRPQIGLILGSGMGELTARIQKVITIPYQNIPQLGSTSVSGHRGKMTLGHWAGQPVLVFEGRLHRYEGHSWDKVVWPVIAAHSLGVRQMILTNAAGGIRDTLQPGSFLAIRDHIEWTKPLFWKKPGFSGLGQSRPSPYSPRLASLLQFTAQQLRLDLPRGIYACLTGPSYETPAEIRALAAWGADAVGMSTAREVQTGFDLGLDCLALSLITNKAAGLSSAPLRHEEVLTQAAQCVKNLADLLEEFLKML